VRVANFAAIAGAAKSLQRLLDSSLQEAQDVPVPGKTTRAVLVRAADFSDAAAPMQIGSPALSVFLYRVDFNKTTSAAWSAVGSLDGRAYLAVDLHFLLTPWADNAEHELRILGKAMQCLQGRPILGGPLLFPDGGWAPNESVQVVQEDIPTEALMRVFDSLPTDYRLSVLYVARIVRIDSRQARPAPPVTTAATGLAPGAAP
jgi:hypothetical protein